MDVQRVAPWRDSRRSLHSEVPDGNPPAGRANHDPRATSRCIIAVFLQRAGCLSSLLAAPVARFSPAAFCSFARKGKQRAARLCVCVWCGVPYADIPHGAMGVTGPSAALNRRLRRVGQWLVLWCVVCGRHGVAFCDGLACHRVVSAGVVRLALASAATSSYHTRGSDMVWLAAAIFRNIHSTAAAGQEQGLPLAGSYHDYRLGG
jgi:hypothetical protein